VESDRVKYGDKRADKPGNGKRLPFTIWGVEGDGPNWGRVQGNNRERRPNSPNQLPEVYLARLIRAYTNPGDWVLDPFGGTGTTAVVCKALKRNCITLELGEANCAAIKDRLKKGAVNA
jgi:site-specific DNA-methyltransferase (adenine-specific)